MDPQDGKAWPGVGAVCVDNKRVGTWFVAGEGVGLTARHVLIRAEKRGDATLQLGSEVWPLKRHAQDTALEQLDVALLDVGQCTVSPLPLARLPQQLADDAFRTYGYRLVDSNTGIEPLHGWGWIRGRTKERGLQLESETVRGGMSGAPLWSQSAGGVVAIILARFRAGAPVDHEPLAFGWPLADLPIELSFRTTKRSTANPAPVALPDSLGGGFIGRVAVNVKVVVTRKNQNSGHQNEAHDWRVGVP